MMTQLRLLRTLSLGYLGQHPMRSILVVLSIALGVATLVATQALANGLNTGIQDGVNPLGSLADLLIVNGQVGVPYELAKKLRLAQLDGVKEVKPFVYWRMSVPDLKNKIVWLFGVELPQDMEKQSNAVAGDNPLGVAVELTYWPKTLGDKLALLAAPPAVVTPNLAAELRANLPSPKEPLTFHLRNAGLKPKVTLVGTIDFAQSNLPLKDSSVVVMPLLAASSICYPDDPGTIHQIGVTLEPGADKTDVQKRIQEWIGTQARVQTLQESKHLISDVTAGLQIGFAIGGAGALVVGLFLVYNILSVSVAERRHDIGILRSVGATRRQIAGLFVGEATCMGLIGSTLGLPLGWLLSWVAIKPGASIVSDAMVPIDRAVIELPVSLILIALCAGTLVANLAAFVPALQAAGEEPADAVRRVPRSGSVFFVVFQTGFVAMLLLLGIGLAQFRHLLPTRWGMFAGIVSILVGSLLATPLLASLFGRVVQPFFRFLFGLEGRLAADNLIRSPGRTGLVIGALAATSGLMVQTSGFLRSSHEAIREWVDEKIAADLFVTSGASVTSGGPAISMQDGMQQRLQAVPGVEVALPVRYYQIVFTPPARTAKRKEDIEKRIVFLVALDTCAFLRPSEGSHSSRTNRPLARSLERFPRLRERGKVCVSENFAALYHIGVGDHFTIPGRRELPGNEASALATILLQNHPLAAAACSSYGLAKGEIDVEVVGTVVDYTWNRGTIILDREWFCREYNDKQVDVYDLFLSPQADVAAVQGEIMERFSASDDLFVVTRKEVNDDVQSMMRRVYALAYAQQSVVGMVALLGVVSALFISVLQRRRELGLLRAVGADRAQILRSVLTEAVLMGLIGATVGFAVGLLLEWYVIDVLLLDEAGFIFPMRIPWLEAGIVMLGSVALATLAGLWPAYLATRLRIPEAIAYE